MINWGLFTIYIICALGLGIDMVTHGNTKKENFFISLLAKAITLVLIWWALGWKLI